MQLFSNWFIWIKLLESKKIIFKTNIAFKLIFKIYILGGFDRTGTSVDGLELFDSKAKIITKVMDDQNNWVKTPIPGLAAESIQTCALPLIDKNAFILSGGRV